MISPDDPYQDLILENPQEYFLPFLGTGRESNNDIWVPARHILFDPAQPGYFCVGGHWAAFQQQQLLWCSAFQDTSASFSRQSPRKDSAIKMVGFPQRNNNKMVDHHLQTVGRKPQSGPPPIHPASINYWLWIKLFSNFTVVNYSALTTLTIVLLTLILNLVPPARWLLRSDRLRPPHCLGARRSRLWQGNPVRQDCCQVRTQNKRHRTKDKEVKHQSLLRYGFTHLSSGDLLREEVASGSERGEYPSLEQPFPDNLEFFNNLGHSWIPAQTPII